MMLNLAANSANGARETLRHLVSPTAFVILTALTWNLPEQWTNRFCLRAHRPFFP
jgi:hypothetical protein